MFRWHAGPTLPSDALVCCMARVLLRAICCEVLSHSCLTWAGIKIIFIIIPYVQGEMLDLQAALSRTESYACQAQADCTLLKQVRNDTQQSFTPGSFQTSALKPSWHACPLLSVDVTLACMFVMTTSPSGICSRGSFTSAALYMHDETGQESSKG